MELTQAELLQRLGDLVQVLTNDVRCQEAGRYVLGCEIAKINELKLRITRYGVTR